VRLGKRQKERLLVTALYGKEPAFKGLEGKIQERLVQLGLLSPLLHSGGLGGYRLTKKGVEKASTLRREFAQKPEPQQQAIVRDRFERKAILQNLRGH
jgi:hypothetical protein